MRHCRYAMADLLPHAGPALLLDSVVDWDQGRLAAQVDIHSGSRFFEPTQGVPGYVGIEYMAQACGAYAGLEAKSKGEPVRVGFLLGTRRYTCSKPWFAAGDSLTVNIGEVLRDGVMGVFDCQIMVDGTEVAAARLNVYQPEDPAAVTRDAP